MFHPMVPRLIQVQAEFSYYFITLTSYSWEAMYMHFPKREAKRRFELHIVVTLIQSHVTKSVCVLKHRAHSHSGIPTHQLRSVWKSTKMDPVRKSKDYLFGACYTRQGSQSVSLAFGRDSNAGRGGASLTVEKRKALSALSGGYWQRETIGGQWKWGVLYDWLGCRPGFLSWVLSWMWRQKSSKLLVTNQILAIEADGFRGYCFRNVTGDRSLTSDSLICSMQAAFLGRWLWIASCSCIFNLWSGPCLFVYLFSQVQNKASEDGRKRSAGKSRKLSDEVTAALCNTLAATQPLVNDVLWVLLTSFTVA